MANKIQEVHDKVKDYYSEITNKRGGELASAVCSCGMNSIPQAVKEIVALLPQEIVERYYGCGSPIPKAIEGLTVLDLGCGTGRDVYVVSKLIGRNGRVIGIDMNDDQLAVAEKYKDEIAGKWGFANVEFKKGYIEDLLSVGIEDETIDLVISNCVINLSPDKDKVFAEIWRVLKKGGILYFSDIFADRHVPDEINTHPLLLGECLGGAMSYAEFAEIIKRNGWNSYEVISSNAAAIDNQEIEELIGNIKYTSDTVRAVKMASQCCCCKPCAESQTAVPYQGKGCC